MEKEEKMDQMLSSVGGILGFVGWIWIIVTAFQKSALWGVGSIIPIIGWIFCFIHWEEGKQPFLVSLSGVIMVAVGRSM